MRLYADGPRRVLRHAIRKAGAPFLILVTPFTVFLQFHGYPYTDAGAITCLAAMALLAFTLGLFASSSKGLELLIVAGLLTFLADVQFHPPKGVIGLTLIFVMLVAILWVVRQHAVQIVTLATSAILLSSVVLPGRSSAARANQAAAPTPHANGPLIVHLILDEQVGVEGFPADVNPGFKARLTSFFVDRGFLLFGRAYSQYFNTYRSISQLVNFESGQFVSTVVAPGRAGFAWDLTQNAYFGRLAAGGYAIRVYQPDYMNFCPSAVASVSCYTYPATSLASLAPLAMSGLHKARVIASMYVDRSNAYGFVRNFYIAARSQLASRGVRLPAWNWERNRVSPVSTMAALQEIVDAVSQARRGEAVFAHLLLPHYPYVYDRDCRVRPPGEWLERMDHSDAPPGSINSPRGRELRYARYDDQVECTQRQLDRVIEAIPEELRRDAVVVVQGDHGSRIALTEPAGDARLASTDYTDSYSTLFAIRSPWLHAGYDRRMVSITCLMRTLGQSDFRSLGNLDACTGAPSVFVAEEKRNLVARPLPPFGEDRTADVRYGPPDR